LCKFSEKAANFRHKKLWVLKIVSLPLYSLKIKISYSAPGIYSLRLWKKNSDNRKIFREATVPFLSFAIRRYCYAPWSDQMIFTRDSM